MKTQMVLLSMAIMAMNSPETVPVTLAPTAPGHVITKPENGFTFFKTHRQGKKVTATWGLITDEGVAGFTLQKTYQDPTDPYAMWEDVGDVDCTAIRSFKYTDPNVFPGSISYRVVALMSGGGSMTSDVSTVQIVAH